MSAVTIFAAIAAISAIALILSNFIGSSRAASTGSPTMIRREVPGDPKEQERNPGDREPNRANMVQMVSLAVLVISVVVLVILIFF